MTTSQNSAESSSAKALDRVRKLFAKAESVAGTPEAEALLERAYALLAKYGVDEALARSGPDARPTEVTVLDYVVSGKYQPDQVSLVASLAGAMHCRAVTSGRGDGTKVVHIVGVRRHVERVGMLAGALTAVMLAAAARQRPGPGVSPVTHRKSFMTGFAFEVGRRLAAAERGAVAESTDAAGAGIVLRSDAQRADTELRHRFPTAVPGSRRRVGTSGIEEGRRVGGSVDLGQRRFDGGRRQIGA
ncbi:DUF2786 domain-containing protein [Rhodococcus sp. IEGM 1408]|uniref:DUF2786 domain-containing protein n=1 Tax=Rhodococcus sp. IEGM 1408 TaxID=3082220 RepID=UPI0029543F9B|nr:DUF2786 domain-containing protein [Rhodococcus sp. IEGM 1408]MDV8001721.1 DUF2786 domain-containing protein [Rhodococcus sp. IEGM 1408]